MAPTARQTAPAAGVDFLSMNSALYSGSFTLPAGRYAMFFETRLQQPKEGGRFNNPRLGVNLTCYNLDKPGAEPVEQFLSMGSKAHEAFAPSADGKGLEPIVGGSGTLTNKSNWSLFRDSLYNAGLDAGVAVNDLSVLDGVWVETAQEPEPEERKGFATATSEVDAGNNKVAGKIPVVVSIIDGGKPWEGGGGVPEAAAKPVAKAQPGKAAPRALPARAAAAPVAAAGELDEDSIKAAAVNAIGTILGDAKYANGCPKLILKTGVFKLVEGTDGKAAAQAVAESFFKTDDQTAELMAEVGYALAGTTWKAA